MKKYLPSLLLLFTAGTIALGCNSIAYAQGDYGNYDNGYDNNYDNGYDNSYNYNNGNYDQYSNGGSGVQITFNDFYTQLAPYGRWVMDPNYGRVWVANVRNFQPYSTNGYWTYTNYGWTWVSNYNWGWAPFHYGRWGYSNINGWFWVPGYQWSPAWVGWSSNADMYGWAPLAPGTSIGVSFSIGSIPINFWTFMPRRYLGYRNIHNYYIPRNRYRSIIRRSNIISNYRSVGRGRYAMGPQPREVARSTGRAVRTTRIVNARSSRNTGVRNNELHMYRPAVRSSSRDNSRSNGNIRSRGNTPTRSSGNVRRASGSNNRSTAPTRSNVNTKRATPPTRAQRSTSTQKRAQQNAQRQRATQQRAQQQRAQQQKAQQQRAQKQRATQQRAQQQRAKQQRAAQQKASQQRAQRQKAAQQRAQRATQRARQQKAERAQRTKQRVQRVQQRSNTRSSGSSSHSNTRRATRSRR